MTTARPAAARPGAVVFTLAFAGIVVSLMQTLIIPIVGDLPKLLNTSASNATWAITVTLLAAAVATPTVGRLGDLYGKRPMLLISIVPLVGGSVLCAFSDSLLPMVIGRALQGLASGLIALGISALRDLMPPERLGSSVALISSSLGIGGALGLPLAAAIAQHSDWHVLFWVSAGLGLVSGLLILLFVPKTPRRAAPEGRSRFDFAGAVGLGAGLASLLLAISKGSDWGWTSGTTLGMLGGAVALLLVWGWWELHCKDPVVDLRTTARGQVLVTNLASVIVGFAMYAQQLIMPQLMELPKATGYGLGQSIQATGLWMMPGGLGMMLVSPIGAKLTARTNAKITLTVGAIVMAAGYGTAVGLMGHPWGLMIAALIASIGVGFGYGAMPALIMGGVPISETASANSFNTLMRSIGTTVSSAVIGVVLAHMTVTMGGVALPSRTGFRTGLLIGCGVAVVAAVVALAIPLNRASRGASAAQDAQGARDPQGAQVEAGSAAEAAAAPTPAGAAGAAVAAVAAEAADAAREPAPAVHGTVLSSDGRPAAGATVTAIDQTGRQLALARSGADGRYAVRPFAPGALGALGALGADGADALVLIASAPGHQPEATTVPLRPGAGPVAVDLRLGGSTGIHGTVLGSGGLPVAGALVVVTDQAGEVVASGPTSAEGAYGFERMAPGGYTLALTAEGHQPIAVPVDASAGGPVCQDLTLPQAAAIRGVVRDPAGRPLAHAKVSLLDAGGSVVRNHLTGEDGAYAFDGLAGSEFTLVATGYPPASTAVSLQEGGRDGVDLALAHGAD